MARPAWATLALSLTISGCFFDLPPLAASSSQDGGDGQAPDGDGGPTDGGQGEAVQPAVARVGLALMASRLSQRPADDWILAVRGLGNATSYENRPTLVLTVCVAEDNGVSNCWFPAPANPPAYPNVTFHAEDPVSPVFDAAASRNVEVVLRVQPNMAHCADLMHAVLSTFGDRPALAGFAIDWGWAYADTDKSSLTEPWLSTLHSYRNGIELYLVGWDPNSFGSFRAPHLAFGYAGVNFAPDGFDDPNQVLATQLHAFHAWSQFFSGSRIGWHWGFDADVGWTRPLCASALALRDLQDRYLALDPEGMLFMTDDQLFFEIEPLLPSAPMR